MGGAEGDANTRGDLIDLDLSVLVAVAWAFGAEPRSGEEKKQARNGRGHFDDVCDSLHVHWGTMTQVTDPCKQLLLAIALSAKAHAERP